MSRERARRREERERERARLAAVREQKAAVAARRRARWAALRALLPRRTRWGRQQGRLSTRRRRRLALVAGGFVAVQVAAWLLTGDGYLRFAVGLLSVLLFPVIAALSTSRAR